MDRIIVDLDPVVYRAAFAAQTTVHEIVFSTEEGCTDSLTIAGDPRETLRNMLDEGWAIERRTSWVEQHEVLKAELAANQQIKSMRERCMEHLDSTDARIELILSGKGNFRNEVATIKPYKGSRAKRDKPLAYEHVRDYLINVHGATVVHGHEADDAVAMRMTDAHNNGDRAILCTIDKDLDQIPGIHYDYKNHVFYEVDDTEAIVLFYAQILCGDATDDIPGVQGLGEQRSKNRVNRWLEEWDECPDQAPGTLEPYLWERVLAEYNSRGIKGYDGSLDDAALEVARLIWLQRFPGQLWEPPTIEDMQ